jgi:hypothetical protein
VQRSETVRRGTDLEANRSYRERGGLHVTVTHLVSGELVSQRDWVRVGLLVVCRSRSLHLADSFVFSHVFVFSHFSGGWADDERTPTTDRTAEQKL